MVVGGPKSTRGYVNLLLIFNGLFYSVFSCVHPATVVSYEPFIVFAPSSSGYTSGQNLEVLYIIRNGIWNIIK